MRPFVVSFVWFNINVVNGCLICCLLVTLNWLLSRGCEMSGCAKQSSDHHGHGVGDAYKERNNNCNYNGISK